jgi:hypothetical protein
MPVWIIERSRDKGVTWKLNQPYHLYKNKEKAVARCKEMDSWSGNSLHRAQEYQPVEVSA